MASSMGGMGMMGMNMNMGMRSMGMGMGSMNMGGMTSSSASRMANSTQQDSSNKLVQLDDKDWEEQFKALDKQDQESSSTQDKGKGKAKETDADAISKEEAEQEAEVRRALDDLEKDIKYDGQSSNSRFEALWESMQSKQGFSGPNAANADAELAKWEEELMKQSGNGVGYSHPGGGIGSGMNGMEETSGWDGTEDRLMDGFGSVSEDGFPRLGSYRFNEQNPFLQHRDPLGEGLRMLSSNGGSLADAALLFEAATRSEVNDLTRGPVGTGGEQDEVDRNRRERSEAWRRLGEAQAMNERETQAIRALEESVRVDEGNGSAMLVSILR